MSYIDVTLQQDQRRLLTQGYDLGSSGADGIYGRFTTAAIEGFEKAQGLAIDGLLDPKTIAALNKLKLDVPLISADEAEVPWLAEAWRRIGLQEVRDNKTLRAYLASDGHTLGDPAKNPWCGDFAQTVIAITLPREPQVSNPYYALNWQKFGVPTSIVAAGALAPFSRPGGGHIAFVVGHDKNYFFVLGGNQSNKIGVVAIEKSRLAGSLRWPSTYPLPKQALPFSTLSVAISHNEA